MHKKLYKNSFNFFLNFFILILWGFLGVYQNNKMGLKVVESRLLTLFI